MRLDVIIPTYNDGEVLKQAVRALADQDIPPTCSPRLIVSDDGSNTLPEREICDMFNEVTPWAPPVFIRSSHKGVSHARNLAIKKSDADILLFLGADILLHQGAVREHYEVYRSGAQAALGFVVWDPRLCPTPLMEWMVHGGPQNDFDTLLGESVADTRQHWYGSHVSCRREVLQDKRFPEVYRLYGWEDLDLGRILHREGVQLRVLHRAWGVHRHRYTADMVQRRQCLVGRSAHIYQNRYPGEQILSPATWQRVVKISVYACIRRPVWALVRMVGSRYTLPRLFLYATAAEFWYGWYKGKRVKPSRKPT